MSIRKYAIGAVAGVCATLSVMAVSDYLQPADPIAVVNQSAQPLSITYALENALGQRQMVVPAGATRAIPGTLAYSDIHSLAVDHKPLADWRVTRGSVACSGNCTVVFTGDGKLRLGA